MQRIILLIAAALACTASTVGAQAMHPAPGQAQAIAAGGRNQLFAIGPSTSAAGDGQLFRWTGGNWQRFGAQVGVRIAVDQEGNPWIVNSRNQIWRLLPGRPLRWEQVPGSAIDIGAGGGQVFILGTDRPAPGNGSVFRWAGNQWEHFGGWGSRIAVDENARPWLVNTSREIWRHKGPGGWERLPGNGRDLGIGANGRVFLIGTDTPAPGNGGIYRWDNGRWTGIGGWGTDIAVDGEGRPIIRNSRDEIWGPFAAPPQPADFGHASMQQEGRRARGSRPLLVVMMRYQDTSFQPEFTRSFFDGLYFGWIGNRVNVMSYVSEMSGRLFTPLPRRERIVGPVTHPMTFPCAHRQEACPTRDSADPGAFQRAYAEILSVPGLSNFDWQQFDRNGDGRITNDELLLVFVQALPPQASGGGINRTFPGGCALANGVQLCTSNVLVSETTGIATIVHELMHSLGAGDVYGARFRMNPGYSLMSATVGLPREQVFHLDPWQKIALGWAEPEIIPITAMTAPIERTLHVPTLTDRRYRPLLVYDPARGRDEFFLVEFRNRLPGTFDEHVGSAGVLVWAVKLGPDARPVARPSFINAGSDTILQTRPVRDDVLLDARTIGWGPDQRLQTRPAPGSDDAIEADAHNFIMGADGRRWGQGTAWTERHGLVRLRWPDGPDAGLQIRVDDFDPSATSVRVTLSFQTPSVTAAVP